MWDCYNLISFNWPNAVNISFMLKTSFKLGCQSEQFNGPSSVESPICQLKTLGFTVSFEIIFVAFKVAVIVIYISFWFHKKILLGFIRFLIYYFYIFLLYKKHLVFVVANNAALWTTLHYLPQNPLAMRTSLDNEKARLINKSTITTCY